MARVERAARAERARVHNLQWRKAQGGLLSVGDGVEECGGLPHGFYGEGDAASSRGGRLRKAAEGCGIASNLEPEHRRLTYV